MPPIDRYRVLTLRAKLTLWTTLGALLIVVAMSSASLWMLRQDTTRAITDAQTALVEAVTRDLDDKITLAATRSPDRRMCSGNACRCTATPRCAPSRSTTSS